MKKKITSAAVFIISGLISLNLCGCLFMPFGPSGSSESSNTNGAETQTEKAEAGKKYKADFNGHEYQFIAEDMTWEEAREDCMRRGGHLVTITSAEEQEFLKNTFMNVSGSSMLGWIGAYSDAYYGGTPDYWCWVTLEEWNYTNWGDGEPSFTDELEFFPHFRGDMTWNDASNEDPGKSQYGYICEYDDLYDELDDNYVVHDEYSDSDGNTYVNGGEGPDSDDVSDNWEEALEGAVEGAKEDPFYKDLGDGRTAIQSEWRGVQIKYPSDFSADATDDALYVFDGDMMYVIARNITAEAEDHSGDLAAFCAAKAEELVAQDFTWLFGIPEGTARVQRQGGDDDHRICDIKGNIWNGTADMWFKSKVFISGKNDDFIVVFTAFWRLDDQTGSDHYNLVKVTSWGRGDMYDQ